MIENQVELDQWESIWLLCSDILKAARPDKFKAKDNTDSWNFGERGDDWKIWDYLILATSKLSSKKPEYVGDNAMRRTIAHILQGFCPGPSS